MSEKVFRLIAIAIFAFGMYGYWMYTLGRAHGQRACMEVAGPTAASAQESDRARQQKLMDRGIFTPQQCEDQLASAAARASQFLDLNAKALGTCRASLDSCQSRADLFEQCQEKAYKLNKKFLKCQSAQKPSVKLAPGYHQWNIMEEPTVDQIKSVKPGETDLPTSVAHVRLANNPMCGSEPCEYHGLWVDIATPQDPAPCVWPEDQ